MLVKVMLNGEHSSITSAKRWVGTEMSILLIYGTIYEDVVGWVGGSKKAKNMLT